MTHITIYKSTNGGIVGFRSAGHAGYAEEGSDIICSAVSILTFNTINSIEKFTDAKFDVSVWSLLILVIQLRYCLMHWSLV